jgi:steroid 5-alpha reductase family enzyme
MQLVIVIALVVGAITWILSLVTHEHSWVDRLWSIVPVVYVWVLAASSALSLWGPANPRLVIVAILVTLWGARLTFNFARKGGYSDVEDYRWAILRTRMTRWQFELFNLFFIVGVQNAVLVLITLPALTMLENPSPVGGADIALTIAFLVFLAGETLADEQQWRFHAAKRAGRTRARFLSTGLWRFSRHPNFFFEEAQWWTVYAFAAVSAGTVLQWTIAGPLALLAVFTGSTIFTESITRSKYPEYADYQARTSPIVPWLPRRERASRVTT